MVTLKPLLLSVKWWTNRGQTGHWELLIPLVTKRARKSAR